MSTSDMSIGVLLLHQLMHYRQAGYEVVAVCTPGRYLPRAEEAGIRVIPVPMIRAITPLADLRALRQLVSVFRRERPDVVHTHTPKAGLLAQWAAWLARVPARIHTIHGLYFPSHMTPRTRPFYVAMERATMRWAHLVLSQNPEDIPVAIRERICREDSIRLLGNGIDLSRFDPARVSDRAVRALREEIGLPENALVVGIVARVNREKGYEELFEAAAIVARDVPGVCFLVIGPVEHEKADALDPEELALRHGVADRLYFLGLRDEMPVLYRLMDVLAHPSHREGWPRAPMEAAAMGVPSVVTDIRGCRQVVVDGTTGIMVPVRDSAALAAALTVLLKDPERRWAMGRAARSHALEAFDEAGVVRRTLEVYREFAPAPAA